MIRDFLSFSFFDISSLCGIILQLNTQNQHINVKIIQYFLWILLFQGRKADYTETDEISRNSKKCLILKIFFLKWILWNLPSYPEEAEPTESTKRVLVTSVISVTQNQ